MNNPRFVFTALAVAAIGAGVCACSPATSAAGGRGSTGSTTQAQVLAQTAAGGGTLTGTGTSFFESNDPGSYRLQAMPTGTVTLSRSQGGQVAAQVNVYGLTPGSSHDVSIAGASGVVHFSQALAANSVGQADMTLTSTDAAGRLPAAGRFVISLGSGGAAGSMAAETIAESAVLPRHLNGTEEFTFRPVDGYGRLAGRATISYNATAQTLSVTVNAVGLTPGAHAAHIHDGSCLSQGPVAYMLMDFMANADGAIVNQTRTVSGVTSVPGPGTWYLNLHLGSGTQILDAAGNPTLYFRPMLCTDISSIAMTGVMPSPSASPSVSASGMASPASSPAASPSGSPTTSPSGSPSASPTGSATATSSPSPSTSPSGDPTTAPTAGPTPVPTSTPSPDPGPTHW